MIRVHNKRGGVIHVLAHGAFVLQPGVSYHEHARFESLGENTLQALADMVKAGELSIGEGEPEPPPEVELTLEPPKPSIDPDALPADDAEALAAIAAETDHARLDAWFTSAHERKAVSEALLARISSL